MVKNVNKKAVENFLMSMDTSTEKQNNMMNAILDAASYKWSPATYLSIVQGIEKTYEEKEK